MALILRRSDDVAGVGARTPWIAATGTEPPTGRPAKLPGAARMLHDAFDAIRHEWWALGRELGAAPGGWMSHASSCGSMNSDLGAMLAWDRIAREFSAGTDDVLMICDDPWLFRHLAGLPGVVAGKAPAIFLREFKLAVRGTAARVHLALRLALAATRLRPQRRSTSPMPTLLVYGHPASDAAGGDAYFGALMRDLSGVARVVHTDCDAARAAELGMEGKALSLHAFGTVRGAFAGLFCRWRPEAPTLKAPYGWLVRRAAAFEGSGAAAAATRWQALCQAAWLDAARPRAVAWPWENHPWERALVREARRRGIATIGYQHTVVGRQMFNMSPHSDPAGLAVLPDMILCNGPAYRAQLEQLGVPGERMIVAGALRVTPGKPEHYDPEGPVFVALPADPRITAQLLAALCQATPLGRRFLVKKHPMYPAEFAETETIRRTEAALQAQPSVAAVLHATGTVGIEAMLSGYPTIRFLPEGLIAVDIMPDGLAPTITDAEGLAAALDKLPQPPRIAAGAVIAQVDLDVWRRYLLAA
jgi:hypothetical protein